MVRCEALPRGSRGPRRSRRRDHVSGGSEAQHGLGRAVDEQAARERRRDERSPRRGRARCRRMQAEAAHVAIIGGCWRSDAQARAQVARPSRGSRQQPSCASASRSSPRRRRWRAGCRRRSSRARPGRGTRPTSRVASMAPIGTPPPSALASVMTSGAMPSCSYAKSVPVRPMPICTSSSMSSRSLLVAELAQLPQIACGRHDDAALALDRLDQDRDRLRATASLHRRDVVEAARSGSPGAAARKPLWYLLLAGRREGRERAAVKRAERR